MAASVICVALSVIFKNQIWDGLTTYNGSRIRNILEIIYFISTPVLLIVATIGLKQISVSKENSRINSLRDSYKLASQQCSYFLSTIIPLYNKVDNSIDAKSITVLSEKEVSIKNKTIKINNKKFLAENDNIVTILPEIMEALNATEAFSVFIISGVADEQIAYNSIGHTFCSCVHKLLPIIIVCGHGVCYKNVLNLFMSWHNKENKQKLISDKCRIEKDLDNISSFNIKSIGT
jgi:hypothetical protein